MKIVQRILDTELTVGQLEYIKSQLEGRKSDFRHTIELPEGLGTVPVPIAGPVFGGHPVPECDVFYVTLWNNTWASRIVPDANSSRARMTYVKPRTRLLRVTATYEDGHMVLRDVSPGPVLPKEPGDTGISSWEELLESRKFWSQHAVIY
jgi:hypothetical protein